VFFDVGDAGHGALLGVRGEGSEILFHPPLQGEGRAPLGARGRAVRSVGWVERSETHQAALRSKMMGFAALYPSYRPCESFGVKARSASRSACRRRLTKCCAAGQTNGAPTAYMDRSVSPPIACLTAA